MTKAKHAHLAAVDGAAIAYTWTGVAYIHGVPARDLTHDEAKRFADIITQQQLLTGLTIYRRSDVTEVAPVADEPAEE